MAPLVETRLKREIVEMAKSPPPHASARPREGNIRVWDGVISGPAGSPYEGGKFNFKMVFPVDYPFSPPKVEFKTKIYHCNINTIGNVCLNVLKKKEDGGSWSSGMGISSILLSLHQLLGEPNPDDPLLLSVANMYKKDKQEHDRIAAIWTKRFAV